jgi:ABC-2 type transport system permease protein
LTGTGAWSTDAEGEFAAWRLELPAPAGAERVWRLTGGILDAGAAEGVYRVVARRNDGTLDTAFDYLGWLRELTPRLGVIPWLVVGWSLFMLWLGGLLNLPKAVMDATPFAALPQLPVETFTWGPVLAVSAIALVLIALGLVGFRRRDIAGT